MNKMNVLCWEKTCLNQPSFSLAELLQGGNIDLCGLSG